MFEDVPTIMLNALLGALTAWERGYDKALVQTPALAQIKAAETAIIEEMNRRYAKAE